ncbi:MULTISPECIES: fused uroporphyrinogen-III synthase HemD/membrane protein HemX [Ralstonia solanacearum species complex]|uniref:Bifunctional uroporphyrinogen-III synthetase/uroporphyrin-III C-methyltransferase n=10 Tax=Ralstonia solanacearum species complex TaxID=3116862 RepID=A0A0S4USK8_RALSL|nr:fused uroporphyrinogen-III synthase HemD/membrane protein HemX [Ralstonia pseudosolanacearum]APC69186.1 fused uroporphyrinogen-III synthase HemD/membrane protein HemX [Ralstonia solanacearum OE1-1]AUS43003.1 fused uroporphyrinogen-III synthase HemD/membrane protein HemX [Ralstonia solanacearum]API74076.1 fused uroporphyrinogen-III synthase/heme biosynthesis operon protein HemX [Ralstonia pseudosolanacearum]ASL74260.1 fused uroporphyrinogen-III synthase HemD/membrane protein HemX [Ralstonia p
MDDRSPSPSSVPPDALPHPSAPVVIVTRPRAQAPMLVAALERHGLRTLQFPLLDIAPTPNLDDLRAALADPSRYALVVFVSPNAVQQAFAAMPEGFRWPQDVPAAVVGPASAQALAAHGVAAPTYRVIRPDSHADDARQDSEALYARLDVATLSGREVLIVRGNGGREWLADRLREAGVAVRTVEAYRRSVPVPDAAAWAALREVLAGRHAWTLTSSEAARNLDSLARASLSAAEVEALYAAPCFAPHARIVEQAQSLGFRDVTLTGAGDDRLLAGVLAWAGPVALAAETTPSPAPVAAPAESNPSSPAPTVSQTPVPTSVPAPGPAAASPGPAPAPAAPTMTAGAGPGRSGWLLWAALILALVVVAGLQIRNERLAREVRQRAQQNETLAQEMRVLSRNNQDAFAQLQQKFGALDARTAETRDRQGALEQASQDLLRNRDDWQRAEIERSLEVASEQLQLTGNVSGALATLQTIDARLATVDKPQFRAMRRAVARDIAKLKAMPAVDLSGAAIRLDDAINGIDALPLVSSAAPLESGQAAPASRGRPARPGKGTVPASASAASPAAESGWSAGVRAWWSRLWHDVRSELGQIVQVRRVDQTDALLLSSDQAWFLRENLKLWLMNARLALLSRNEAVFRADLGRADTLLARYFDTQSPRVVAEQTLLQQARASVGALEVPTLADSLAAARGQGKE